MREHTNIERKFKRIRREYNLTQEDLASWLCLPRQTIGNIESGRHIPQRYLLKYISVVFDIDLNWLMDDEWDADTFNFPYSSIAELTARFRNLTEEHQDIILELMRYFENRQNIKNNQGDEYTVAVLD